MNWTTAQASAVFARLGIINNVEAACGQPPRRSKYNVDLSPAGKAKRTADGILFGSEREMRGYQTLKIAERHGLVSSLRLQPRYELQAKFTDAAGKKHRAVVYVADFTFQRGGRTIVVDVKGTETHAFRIKAKLFVAKYPHLLFEIWR